MSKRHGKVIDQIEITKREWDRIQDDHKVIKRDGQKLCFLGCIEEGGGTILVPVKVIG